MSKSAFGSKLEAFDDSYFLGIKGFSHISAIFGAVSCLILPGIVLVLRISACIYGLDSDYSGLFCFLPFLIIAYILGGIMGAGYKSSDDSSQDLTSKKPLIRIIMASILAIILGVIISVCPAFMFAIPDC